MSVPEVRALPPPSPPCGELRRRRRARAALGVVGVLGATIVVASQDACVLADPTSDLPRLPPMRPTIVHGSVIPSTSAVLGVFPKVFIVPVELADPTQRFQYAAFIDYNPLTGDGLVVPPTTSLFERDNTVARIRTITVPVGEPTERDRCHVVEIVVASSLSNDPGRPQHAPGDNGDIVTWFYNPNGDLGSCPTVTAGIDASVDAGDAGEAAVQ